jgi:hypothetical protein
MRGNDGFQRGLYPNPTNSSIGKSGQSTAFPSEMPHCSRMRDVLTGARPFGLCWEAHIDRQRRIAATSGRTAMNTMKDREEGFERKFAFDEELRFKATARRNKMLGLWAAEKLGKSGDEAETYAKEVIISDIEEAGDHDVFRKVRKDFDDAGVQQSDHQIRRTMDELMAQAIEQVKNS